MKKSIVLGAGGFIGTNLVSYLKKQGHWVCGVDLKSPRFCNSDADEFIIADLRQAHNVEQCFKGMEFNYVFQLAAQMGGADYIFTEKNDADIMSDSLLIDINVLNALKNKSISSVVFSSSACVYNEDNQKDQFNPLCSEETAYPANPDSNYGWTKLIIERLYESFFKNHRMPIKIARLHNIYGPYSEWDGGREKAPAALCRKVAKCTNGDIIKVYGSGHQTRSFLYIDDCVDGLYSLATTPFKITGPYNIGSERLITINDLSKMIIGISGKDVTIKNVNGPVGVNGRVSVNTRMYQDTKWEETVSLEDGMKKTYNWIEKQINERSSGNSDNC